MNKIDINFHYTEDAGGKDPDIYSLKLREDLLSLYRKELPNGTLFDLQKGQDNTYDYLVFNGWRFGSDSISNTYTHQKNYQWMIRDLEKTDFYNELIDKYRAIDYTIGCHTLFPKNNNPNNSKSWSINQERGTNPKICDRMDLTLECIRRFYNNENSPLYYKFQENVYFFDLFKDKNGKNGFEGYVNFFYLNDLLVNNDYTKINYFLPFDNFERFPKPQDINEWKIFCEKQIEFINARNKRISNL